jgi:hypothetical protein
MTIKNETRSLGVLTVATNIYINYWREMAITFDIKCKQSDNVVLHVFTNQLDVVERVKTELKNVLVVGHEIPNYKWPEATLLRYQIFNEAAEEILEDILMHLDADMLINESPLETIIKNSTTDQVCLVSHPGYWRPKAFITRANFYRKNLTFLLNDLRMTLKIGGLGSWEMDRKSAAYVPRRYRRNYVCGGTWFGERGRFLTMVSELSRNVTVDLNHNKVAIWHDESHLNSWSTQNSHFIIDPELCFVPSYPQLQGLTPIITAVDKEISTR